MTEKLRTVLNAFILLASQVFLIIYYDFSSVCSKMFVLVKNMLAVLKWLLANNACSFVDLLWRRKFCRKSTCPKFSEIQEKQP